MKIFVVFTVLFFLAIFIFLLRGIFLLKREKTSSTQTFYEVSLKDLSPIWLKYNKEFEGEKHGEDFTLEVLVKPVVANKDNQQDEIKLEEVTETKNLAEPKQVKSHLEIDTLNAFYNEVISPYEKQFKEQNAYEVLIEILKMLDKHGSVPSVVIDVKDNESVDLISVRDNLAQISLKEHVFAVTRAMVELVKQNYSEPENFMPQAIIIALAHDIGKIPELRLSGAYNSYDHAIVSSNWLAEQFTGKDIFWAKQAVTAVRDHHLKSKEPLTVMLREADKQARQMELVRFTQNYSIEKFDSWFRVDEFLKIFKDKVNVTAKGKVDVFLFKGIIYAKPDSLYEVAKQLMFDKKILDMLFLYESEKESAVRKIVEKLREKNLIPDIISEPYVSRKFEIRMKMQIKKQTQVLVAIKADPYGDELESIERRKAGSQLELVEAVIPI
ncbi:MAG: HD domain-containing protein [Thermoplasmata archaeon]